MMAFVILFSKTNLKQMAKNNEIGIDEYVISDVIVFCFFVDEFLF